MSFSTVGVIGAGVMGGGIAQFFAERGVPVLLWDADANALERGLKAMRGRLTKSAEKGAFPPEQVDVIMGRVTAAADVDAFRAVDLAIEAVIEQPEVKNALLAQLSAVMAETAVIGTNTSSLRVSELAAACHGPERFLGIHFFNPPTKLELVEVVPTPQTAPEVTDVVRAFLTACGKTPVTVQDAPGFIVNRLLLLMINEAARMVDEGVASAEDIDTAMRLGALHPAGPLAVADLIGLDTCAHILRILKRDIGASSYEPADGISERVAAGKLGRKSGEGFFTK